MRSFAVAWPELDYASLLPTFTALAHENPLISRFQRTGDGRPYRISDMIDQQTFHALALYQRVLPPHGGRVAGRVQPVLLSAAGRWASR